MRVFILCTGRSGSTTIIEACKKIKNYTAGHEALARELGEKRFAYPENHIEADNRLSWFLGTLNEKFGDDAIYVHLKRDRKKTAESFMNRFGFRESIVKAFCDGIIETPIEKLSKKEKLQACFDYVDTVNTNVDFFLRDKSKKMVINLENIKEDFSAFWELIGAEGDLDSALKEFDIRHNSTPTGLQLNFRYTAKLFLLRIWRVVSGS